MSLIRSGEYFAYNGAAGWACLIVGLQPQASPKRTAGCRAGPAPFRNITQFVVKADGLEDLLHLGPLTRSAVRFLAASAVAGLNILVAGGAQPWGYMPSA
jgi:hypothetical protein